MTLLSDVLRHLERNDVRAVLMGAAAMPVYGVARATHDSDVITVDRKVLSRDFWTALENADVDVRRGDPFDPLAGVVRLKRPRERQVDVVVGKYIFIRDVIERAEVRVIGGVSLPVARLADLILLKLFAGGPQDAWDIGRLLESSSSSSSVVAEVESHISELPSDAQELWSRIRAERG